MVFVYNSTLIPVAAGVLFPFFGILLNPIFAAAAMGLSSVTVVTNALRLRRFKPLELTQTLHKYFAQNRFARSISSHRETL